ncbi:MAG: tetratricopeptide repeat protein [Prevotella sp.]
MRLNFANTYHIILTFAVLMTSCDTEWRQKAFGLTAREVREAELTLSKADSLMEIIPDSAYKILLSDSSMFSHAEESERMLYSLLRTQAEYKLYIRQESDATIREVADYYKQHGSPARQALAYYLLGGVNQDNHHSTSAIAAWKKAMEVEGTDSVTYRYKSRSATSIGLIYQWKDMHDMALGYYQSAHKYALHSDCPDETAYTLRNIGRILSFKDNDWAALKYYKDAVEVARQIGDRDLQHMVEIEMSATYIDVGMLKEAKQILIDNRDNLAAVNTAAYYYTIGNYYEATANADSARHYYLRCIDDGDYKTKKGAAERLAKMYKRLLNDSESTKYHELASVFEDSVRQEEKEEMLDNAANIKEKAMIEKRAGKTEAANRKIMTWLLSVIAMLVIAGYIICQHERRERKKAMAERENTLLTHGHGMVCAKHQKDFRAEHDRQDQPETVADTKATAEAVEAFVSSKIYRMFHNINFNPSEADFILLEESVNMAYNGFTARLKEHSSKKLNKDEIRLCCLVKTGLHPKMICHYTKCSPSTLSMRKKRLYKKIHDTDGGASEFDIFIENF